MHTDERTWRSPALGHDMTLKVYGHDGRPIVAFPSQDGRWWDFEGWGMIDACAGIIDAGRARIIAVDGIDWQSWTNESISPPDRARRHDAYDRYLADEVVPFMRELTGWERGWATGASMGGYHAANLVFRHPDQFDGLVAMSGRTSSGCSLATTPARRSTSTARCATCRASTIPGTSIGCARLGWPSSAAAAPTRSRCSPTPGRSATSSPRRASRPSSTSGATT